jgi:uncharacterized protein with NRDE domain
MCTLVVAARTVPELPLVIVANRDEETARPSRPPFRWDVPRGVVGFIAPRDERAGGTWLGWNDHGVFVGILNRHPGASRQLAGEPISRGAIVVDALQGSSAAEVHHAMARLDPTRYNGFHLVYADVHGVYATIGDGRDLSQLSLGSGLTIVTERSFGATARPVSRESRVRSAWTALRATLCAEATTAGPVQIERFTSLLTEHDAASPLAATCVHLEARGYGTRSSMVLAVPSSRRVARMMWADGPPCTTPFVEVLLGENGTNVPRAPKTG